MKYKITLAYSVDVEAESELEAQAKAEASLKRDIGQSPLKDVMSVYYGEGKVYIPENDYLIKEGYYDLDGIVGLLRAYKTNPNAIEFIADMLEV